MSDLFLPDPLAEGGLSLNNAGASHFYSPHPKSLSQAWERDFEPCSPFPKFGRRGWEMRAKGQNWDASNNAASVASLEANPNPTQERLQLIAIGSRQWVAETIHTLHSLGFAQAGEWSVLLPAASPGEVMSVLTRYRRVEE